MAWSTMHKASEEDFERVESSARRFAVRHDLFMVNDCNGENEGLPAHLEVGLIVDDRPGLRPLWRRCVVRALGPGAEGIAYGYVGFHVND
jgi:hypothetical protein